MVLVRVDCDHNTINSDAGHQNDGANGRAIRRNDEDENDGEESPLQSKRSSRSFFKYRIGIFLKSN